MADIKISQLPDQPTPTDADILPIVSGGTTKRVTKANLLASAAPVVHTHTSAAVTDFTTAVAANITVAANTAHAARTDNPHATTKAQVGLGSVDNTSDASKSLSTAATTALAGKEPSITAGTTAQYYRGDKSFQALDKTAVGLPAVDNTSDASKPISTATQTALATKADAASLTAHTSNTSNPHSVTKAQVGLGSVDNVSLLAYVIDGGTP